jgi:hypothetical protein
MVLVCYDLGGMASRSRYGCRRVERGWEVCVVRDDVWTPVEFCPDRDGGRSNFDAYAMVKRLNRLAAAKEGGRMTAWWRRLTADSQPTRCPGCEQELNGYYVRIPAHDRGWQLPTTPCRCAGKTRRHVRTVTLAIPLPVLGGLVVVAYAIGAVVAMGCVLLVTDSNLSAWSAPANLIPSLVPAPMVIGLGGAYGARAQLRAIGRRAGATLRSSPDGSISATACVRDAQ